MRYIRSRMFVSEASLHKDDQGPSDATAKVMILGSLVNALIAKVKDRTGYVIPMNAVTDLIEFRTVWRPERKGWAISATFFAPIDQPDLFSKETK